MPKLLDEIIIEFGNLRAAEGFPGLVNPYESKNVLVSQTIEFSHIKAFVEWLDQYHGDTII